MSPLLERKLRIGAVAGAIGTSPKVISNWLQRGQFKPLTEDAEGWRNYSFADVAALALTKTIVGFGLTVEHASEIAWGTLRDRAGLLLQYQSAPPPALVALLTGCRLYIQKQGDGWNYYPEPLPLPADHDLGAYIYINVEIIVGRAFKQLEDWLDPEEGESQ